jgi:UPF0271 protein
MKLKKAAKNFMLHIDINCDMGEGIGNEEALMPFISSANIACGYHAGNSTEMERMVDLCIKYDIAVGAHPSFADKENFGRTEMQLPLNEIYVIVTDQLKALNEIATVKGTKLHHVKPHGALYNMAARQMDVASTIAKAVKDFNPSLIYYGLSGSVMIEAAKQEGLFTASEVFADRTYQPNGSLTPRTLSNALITETAVAVSQVQQMINKQSVTAVNGATVYILADTVCLHGDGIHAAEFAKALYTDLQEAGITIKKVDY